MLAIVGAPGALTVLECGPLCISRDCIRRYCMKGCLRTDFAQVGDIRASFWLAESPANVLAELRGWDGA